MHQNLDRVVHQYGIFTGMPSEPKAMEANTQIVHMQHVWHNKLRRSPNSRKRLQACMEFASPPRPSTDGRKSLQRKPSRTRWPEQPIVKPESNNFKLNRCHKVLLKHITRLHRSIWVAPACLAAVEKKVSCCKMTDRQVSFK